MKSKFSIFLSILFFCIYCCSKSFGQNIEQYKKFELNIDLSTLSTSNSNLINSKNPFKKDEIILEANFTSPNGSVTTINGFYYEGYSLVQDNSNHHSDWPYLAHEYANPNGINNWKVRFTPDVLGTWTYTIKFYFVSENRYVSVTSGQFTCSLNSNSKSGFVKIKNSDYFAYPDGTGFIPIGVNIYHYPYWSAYQPKVNFYELYFKNLSENGANLVSLTCDFRGALSLATVKGCTYYLDTYSMPDAYILDLIISKAEKYNIKLIIRLFSHENFGETNAWEHWNTYNINSQMPYCSPNPHGVCNTKDEFFTLNAASIHQDNYIKYIIDRYGYSPSIMAWEIFSEADGAPIDKNVLINWHRNKISLIKSYDKYNRAVTTAFAGSVYNPTANYYHQIDSMVDYIELHRYTNQWTDNYDFRTELYNEIKPFKDTYKKPVFVTEGGNLDISLDYYEVKDPHGFAYHESLWSNAFHGVCGTYLDWTWYAFIDRNNPSLPATDYMKHMNAISKYLNNLPAIGKKDQITSVLPSSSSDNLCVLYFTANTEKKIYGWVQDNNFLINKLINTSTHTVNDYLKDLDPSKKPSRASITNSFTLTSLPITGNIKISWYDTETGLKILETSAVISSNQLTLTIPSILMDSKYGDAAFIIETSSTGWQESALVPSSNNTVLAKTDIKYGNGQLFYSRDYDGKVHTMYRSPAGTDNWVDNWVNPSAPNMKNSSNISSGLEVVPQNNNEIFYVSYNQQLIDLYWNGSNWSYSTILSNVKRNSPLHYGNGQLFYIDNSGGLNVVYNIQSGTSYSFSLINSNAPKVMDGTNFELVPQNNNEIYYVGVSDGIIYRLYWGGSSWLYEKTVTSNLNVRPFSEMHYGNGQLFFVNSYGFLHTLYKNGNSWTYNWLNGNAPKVKTGTGFALIPELNNTIYYIGEDNNIYKMYWIYAKGWVYEQINIANSSSGGGKDYEDLIYAENSIFYVAKNDSKIHRLLLVYNIPFTVAGSNINQSNNYDVQGADGRDVAYKFYVPNLSIINATVCNTGTNFDTKLEIFNSDGTRAGYYNDDYSCSVNNYFSTISGAQLNAGYYYVVVDGYNGATGNFNLSVASSTLLKSASVSPVNLSHIIADNEDLGKYDTLKLKSPTIINSISDNKNVISIFPNPVSTNFKIKSSYDNLSQVSLLDLQGRLIHQYSGISSSEIEINCNEIVSGIYLVKVMLGNKIGTYKISISKK